MTSDHDRVEEHLDDLGRALSAAAHSPARRDRRPLVVTGVAVAAAAVATVVVLAASPDGTPADVLGRAEAALNDRGELVHYAYEQRSGPAVGSGADTHAAATACAVQPVEVWRAAEPSRWRIHVSASVRDARCGSGPDESPGARPEGGAYETSWADGTQSEYDPSSRRLHVTTGYAKDGAASRIPSGVDPSHGAVEPIAELRGLLRRGALHDAGERTLGGRRVRSFTSRTTERILYGQGTSARFARTVVYDVDAATFAPVRSLQTFTIPNVRRASGKDGRPGPLEIHGGRRYVEQLDFTAYDRRPLDAAARSLLVIHPAAGTRTTRLTHEEALRRMRRSSPHPVYR